MVQGRAILTIVDQQQVVRDLSIDAIFSDLERPPNPYFQGHAYMRCWICQ